MLNKLREFIRTNELLQRGDKIVCAVSGGADSVALLFGLYLLKEKLGIELCAAHFNHGLRGEESDRDEQFVRQLCDRLDIPLSVGTGAIVAGKKGLEAAARDARYAYLHTLPGKIATAHTADDNAETVLMHMIRGTGLKGLGGIAPINGRVIRPLLLVTRNDVERFLSEYNLSFVKDSSNDSDSFMRNRIRHNVIPLLKTENPSLAENLSAMALRLREDEQALAAMANDGSDPDVFTLRKMAPALRNRWIISFLSREGYFEPEAEVVNQINRLIFSDKPSAKMMLSSGLLVTRQYDRLLCCCNAKGIESQVLHCPGEILLDDVGVRIQCKPADRMLNELFAFTVSPVGTVVVRSRMAGDSIRLPGGTKTLKRLFIDKKIPAMERDRIAVIADDVGVLGICGFGCNLDRLSFDENAIAIHFERISQ